MFNKLAVAVILYKPEKISLEKICNNIISYADFIYDKNGKGGVYIIDNSPNCSEELLTHLRNKGYYYYQNKNIGGIAGAQNFACRKALEDGFKWLMTMDQDSFFNQENLSAYINYFYKYSEDSKIKSFSLRVHRNNTDIMSLSEIILKKYIRYKILSPLKRKLLRIDSSKIPVAGSDFYDGPCIDFPKLFVPASANIINLDVWKELGGFDESLFIDQVDNDFSIRLTTAGFKIIRFNNIFFYHQIGEKKYSIMTKRQPYYDSFRLYYVFRNHLIMLFRYPKYKKIYRRELKWFIIENLVFNWRSLYNFFIFIRAFKDYKKYIKNSCFHKK